MKGQNIDLRHWLSVISLHFKRISIISIVLLDFQLSADFNQRPSCNVLYYTVVITVSCMVLRLYH